MLLRWRLHQLVSDGQTIEEMYYYSKLLMKQGTSFAKVIAYKEAGFEYEITNNEYAVVLVDKEAITDLKVGDVIVSINDNKINEYEEISNTI